MSIKLGYFEVWLGYNASLFIRSIRSLGCPLQMAARHKRHTGWFGPPYEAPFYAKVFIRPQKIHALSLICKGTLANHLKFGCNTPILFLYSLLLCNAGCTLSPSAFARVSAESCPRRDWASATLYTLAESSQFWRVTRGNSQARHKTHLTRAHGLLKNRDLDEARHECRGYTRGSKARRVFPSTLSLSPYLEFSRSECTASLMALSRCIRLVAWSKQCVTSQTKWLTVFWRGIHDSALVCSGIKERWMDEHWAKLRQRW